MDNLKLRALASNPANALEIGKAAEHLVVADLILTGYRAFLSDQGLPYDVVADIDGRLVRIQVKSTCFPKNVNANGRAPRVAYTWAVRARGKRRTSRLSDQHCDIIALVALDIRTVAYLPIALCGETIQLVPPGHTIQTVFKSQGQWARPVDGFPFDQTLTGSLDGYIGGRREHTHCPHGHEFTPANTYHTVRGSKVCKACQLRRNAAAGLPA